MKHRRRKSPNMTGADRPQIPLYTDVVEAIRKRDAARRRGDFALEKKLDEKVKRLQNAHLRDEIKARAV